MDLLRKLAVAVVGALIGVAVVLLLYAGLAFVVKWVWFS